MIPIQSLAPINSADYAHYLTPEAMQICEAVIEDVPDRGWREELRQAFDLQKNFITTTMDACAKGIGLFDIGNVPESWEARGTTDVIYKMLTLPVFLFVGVSASLGVGTALAVTTVVTLAGMALMVAYVRWLRPCPELLRFCHNYVRDAKMGKLRPTVRCEETEKLIEGIIGKQPTMLVGEAGSGKTARVEDLAYRIARGEIPELKDVQLFALNAAEMSTSPTGFGNCDDKLTQLLKWVTGYEQKVVFFIDNDIATLSRRLLSILDHSRFAFIAATTPEEYGKMGIEYTSRFQRIDVKTSNLTEIVKTHLKGEAATDEAIAAIVKNDPSPRRAVQLTKRAMARVRILRARLTRDLQDLKKPCVDVNLIKEIIDDSRPIASSSLESKTADS